jgi:3D (Asp-Asp-Asp) domain-containing protein
MAVRFLSHLGVIAALVIGWACAAPASDERGLRVTASAYNSLSDQTDGNPTLTAWGDRLEPGVRAIAVSRDLIPMGLRHGTRVRIDGLPGEFRVLDKMGKRWTRKIDIYMGVDVDAAIRWGVRPVTIRWRPSRR